MARYTGPVCRLCRREGMKLFLKGDRCYTDKCAYRAPPVSAGPARPGPRQALGVRRRSCARSRRSSASTACSSGSSAATSASAAAEGRDGREPAAAPRASPRQRGLPPGLRVDHARGAPAGAPRPLHGQRQAGRTSRRSSCKPGDEIEVSETSSKKMHAHRSRALGDRRPAWRAAVARARQGQLQGQGEGAPRREDLTMPIREQLIVEFYSQVSSDSQASKRDRHPATRTGNVRKHAGRSERRIHRAATGAI